MKAIHKKRLLNVARALRESEKPKAFTMSRYLHDGQTEAMDGCKCGPCEELRRFGVFKCGTPACAFGHYAARPDLQRLVKIVDNRLSIGHRDHETADHFGVSEDEAVELFDEEGCGGAKTGIRILRYDVRDTPVVRRLEPDRGTSLARSFNWVGERDVVVNRDRTTDIRTARARCSCGVELLISRSDWVPRAGGKRPPPQRCGQCNRRHNNDRRRGVDVRRAS